MTSANAAVGFCEQPGAAYRPSAERVNDPRLTVDAGEVELSVDGISQLRDGVTVRQAGREFVADRIDYDPSTGELRVESESVFRNPEVIIGSREARFDLRRDSGRFLGTHYTLPTLAARGTSEEIRLSADGTAELYSTAYTTCGPSSDAWYVEADRIHLDHDRGLGTARNARVRFGGVPVLWTPYLQFPIDDQRRSGLLYPTLGQSDRTGFDFSWPVYLNLLPNADATVTPRYMSDRGLQLGLEGRYLLRQAEGNAALQWLEDDRVTDQVRSLFHTAHRGVFNERLGFDATFVEVSDPDYFVDLGGGTETSSISNLERHARLIYQSPGAYRVQAMVQSWQPITSRVTDIDEPYSRAPQILFDALSRNAWWHTRAGINGELVNFVRDDDSVEAVRTDLQPYLRFERDEIAWYVNAQADLRYTGYMLSNEAADQHASPERMLPVVSAESGLRFERTTDGGGLQTLEPRAFALYVPYEDQSDIPLFDTGEPDFGFVQLFARNRFSGADRISDARQIAGSVTTRRLDPMTGVTRWSASLGQLYRFESPRVELPGEPAPPSGATEFVGEFEYRISSRWQAALANLWSPREDRFDRASAALRYRDPTGERRFDVVYRYRRELLEQTDVSLSWPIAGHWRIAARSRYSLRDSASLDTLAGLEYATCCLALRTSWRRYILNNVGEYNSGIYLEVELRGLARLGTGYDQFLPGYGNTPDEDVPF